MTEFPESLKEKFLHRISQLIDEGEEIKHGVRHYPAQPGEFGVYPATPARSVIDDDRFMEWRSKCQSLADAIVPRGSIHEREVNVFAFQTGFKGLRYLLAKMKAIHDDLRQGFFDNVEMLIRAEVAGDYMGQAEMLYDQGYHVPASVLAGAVLEDTLRKLCEREGIPSTTDKGKQKTIEPMNIDLAKKNIYNAAKAAEIRGWAALRNDAAHGNGDKVEPEAVGRMIAGVRSFVADYSR